MCHPMWWSSETRVVVIDVARSMQMDVVDYGHPCYQNFTINPQLRHQWNEIIGKCSFWYKLKVSAQNEIRIKFDTHSKNLLQIYELFFKERNMHSTNFFKKKKFVICFILIDLNILAKRTPHTSTQLKT